MSLISEDFLSTKQFAKLKNVTERTVQKWVDQKIAPPFELFAGRRCFYKAKAIAFELPKRGRKLNSKNRDKATTK